MFSACTARKQWARKTVTGSKASPIAFASRVWNFITRRVFGASSVRGDRSQLVAGWVIMTAVFLCTAGVCWQMGKGWFVPRPVPVVFEGLRLDDFSVAYEQTGATDALYDAYSGSWMLLDDYGREVGRIDLTEGHVPVTGDVTAEWPDI